MDYFYLIRTRLIEVICITILDVAFANCVILIPIKYGVDLYHLPWFHNGIDVEVFEVWKSKTVSS